MEAIDGDPDTLPEHLAYRRHIASPHVGRNLDHVGEQTRGAAVRQVVPNGLFFAAFEDFQHAAVRVIDDHRYELTGFFFNANSSMPSCAMGWRAAAGAWRCRSA